MLKNHSRMARERNTVEAMINMYCHDLHGNNAAICLECKELLAYAGERLKKCPFQQNKTTCDRCPVHCYKNEMRMKIRDVMRYAGPRMFRRHPVLTLFHFLDGLRKKPVPLQRKPGNS
ncbi:MAG: nitrous oxide-stimulated promoter family protein [Thermodesulfobacteriota bacterium]|nr:nitrous oxide-stimulated promoter family protein [Thermodesulfobacteriota bacterium]